MMADLQVKRENGLLVIEATTDAGGKKSVELKESAADEKSIKAALAFLITQLK